MRDYEWIENIIGIIATHLNVFNWAYRRAWTGTPGEAIWICFYENVGINQHLFLVEEWEISDIYLERRDLLPGERDPNYLETDDPAYLYRQRNQSYTVNNILPEQVRSDLRHFLFLARRSSFQMENSPFGDVNL